MITLDEHLVRVVDLKQHVYCPRILFYHNSLPDIRPTTYKMKEGKDQQDRVEDNEKRRSLKIYGLSEGTRTFEVAIIDRSRMLSGQIDMVIESEDEVIPVDFKLSRKVGNHFKLQLMAYGLLLRGIQSKPVTRGFVYLIPEQKAIEIKLSHYLEKALSKTLGEIHEAQRKQSCPPPTQKINRCIDCEFRRFCNDTL